MIVITNLDNLEIERQFMKYLALRMKDYNTKENHTKQFYALVMQKYVKTYQLIAYSLSS